MKYLETIHERNSAKITTLIVVILVLLLFIVGPPYLDPPLEYGVAVNFGTSELGSGNVQPTEPIKSEPKKVIEEPKVEASKIESSTPSNTKAENVLTEENAEAIAIKKQKEAEAKALAEAERKEQLRKEAEERKRQEEADKKKKLDALIGGVSKSEGTQTGGEGPDSQAGDKGQLDGDPYEPSYFGGSGPGKGGVGYGLNGRGRPTRQIFKQDCNEYGLVVVKIEVDRSGKVVSAQSGERGTTNTHPCLLEPAKKIALSHKWPADSNAPARQIGFVSINFDISQ
ncbi:MAG TPA: energy transducer TonB [Flavobacteriaceae bacterium]